MSNLKFMTLISICSMFSAAAFAVDGVVEINHSCATQSGCFSGDTAGYPVTVNGSAGRSYRLTSDLIVALNKSGIVLSSPSISIDLNGFAIMRSGCEGATTDCSGAESPGSGISATADYAGISVRNGSIIGMGQYGIRLEGFQAEVKDMRVRWNSLNGIQLEGNSSTIKNTTSSGNRQFGIFVQGIGAVISGNSVFDNGLDGLRTGVGATVSGNTANENGRDGIAAGTNSTISHNTAYKNTGDGISTSGSSLLHGNTVSLNNDFGLNLGVNASSGYRENVMNGNVDGAVFAGTDMGNNLCDSSTTCP